VNTSDEAMGGGSRKKNASGSFTEEEIARVTEGPEGDPELDGIDPAEIEDRAADLETPFEKVLQKSRRLSPDRVRTVLESILFVSDRSLSLEQLYEATGIDREKIEEALAKMSGTFREGICGMVLTEVAGGWQFRTDASSSDYVRRFLRVKPQRRRWRPWRSSPIANR
jgi:segregation and condensation protein B